MVELIRMAAHGICELRPPQFQSRHLPIGTIQGMLPAPVFGGLGTTATRPMRVRTSAKVQMHCSTRPPATTPTAQPTCSSGRHRFDDIGPLPKLMAMILASAVKSRALDQCWTGRQGAYLPAHVTLATILLIKAEGCFAVVTDALTG